MHICLITPSFPPQVDGGVAISTGRLVEHLLAMGHRITVLTGRPSESLADARGHLRLEHERLHRHYGLMHDPLRAGAAVADLCGWAAARHGRLPFAAILAYFVYPAGHLATILGTRLGLPVVCSCRGNDISKDVFIDPATVAGVLEHSTRLMFVCDSLLRMADALVPCRAKATIVPNAVDTRRFGPAAGTEAVTPRRVTLGTSGVLRWKKGIDLFLPLITRLHATHRIRVLIAGYGLDAVIDRQMADFIRHHHLQEQVELTGAVSHGQMVHALQRMDLYVSTSYQEGMPNGVLEAMACGLPVVATDADGTAALVEDGHTGYLCRMGDLEMFAARCRRLIEQPALRRRLGQAGRQRVLAHFRPHHEARAVEAVLRQACLVQAQSGTS